MAAKAVASRGRGLMRNITVKPFHLLKAEVDEMTDEEARDVWTRLEPFFPGICARASSRRRDAAWLELVRKMQLVRRRAEGGG
jgi:hypothetical protein